MKSLKEISDELRSYSAHLNEVNDQSLIEIKENITKNIDELIAGFEPISAEYNTMETLEQDAAVYSKCPLQQLKFFLDAIIATLEYSAQLVNESDYCPITEKNYLASIDSIIKMAILKIQSIK